MPPSSPRGRGYRLRRPRGEGSAPAGVASRPRTRAAPGLRPGALRPPARSSLTAAGAAGRVGGEARQGDEPNWRRDTERPARSQHRKRGPGAARKTPRRRAERRHAFARTRDIRTGRATWRAVPLAFLARTEEDGPTWGPTKNTGGGALAFFPLVPAKAGTQSHKQRLRRIALDSRFRGNERRW